MSVSIGPAYSVVIRRSSLLRASVTDEMLVGTVADLISQDSGLLVLGPLYETTEATQKLDEMGLEYFEDYFDIPHSGGPVADWCEIELRLRTRT